MNLIEIKILKETSQLKEMSDQLQTVFNEFKYDIVMNEDKRNSLDLNEKEKEFNNIMDERKEYLLRLEVIIGNMKV